MSEFSQSEQKKEVRQPRRRSWLARHLYFFVILVLVGAAVTFGMLYFRSNAELDSARRVSSVGAAEEASTLIEKISIHMTLPDEKPTIATVEDTKKLANQAFFKNAQNGDKVLMYTQSKKAILYRPSEDKVIEVSYLNIKQ